MAMTQSGGFERDLVGSLSIDSGAGELQAHWLEETGDGDLELILSRQAESVRGIWAAVVGDCLAVADTMVVPAEGVQQALAELGGAWTIESDPGGVGLVRLVTSLPLDTGSLLRVIDRLRFAGVPAEPDYVLMVAAPRIKVLAEPIAVAARHAAVPPSYGNRVVVALVDTGIGGGQRFDGALAAIVPRPDDIDPSSDDTGRTGLAHGHGTAMAGIIEQLAPGVEIRPYRVVDEDGLGGATEVADAIVRAATDGAHIVYVGLVTSSVDDEPPACLMSRLFEVAALNPDLLVVTPAGNFGDTRPTWPAAAATELPNVVSVAGLDPDGNPAPWSSRGPWVTCSAVGQGVIAPFVEGVAASRNGREGQFFGADPFAAVTGTSVASAVVTGAIAQAMIGRGVSPREALAHLLNVGAEVDGFGACIAAPRSVA